MPARAVIEEIFIRIVRFVGYLTARIVVPILSLGWVAVAPASQEVTVIRHGFHRASNGKIVIDTGVGAAYGWLFWAIILVGVLIYARL